MFFVINKEKLYAYVVSIITVVMLFVVAGMIAPKNNTVETSANIQEQNLIQKNNEVKQNTNNKE